MIINDETSLGELRAFLADKRLDVAVRGGDRGYQATLSHGTTYASSAQATFVDAIIGAFEMLARHEKPSTIPAPDAEEDGAA